MPTFDFRCKKCETVFEFARPFGSKAVPACPECNSKLTEKLLGAPAVVFKGAGWYKTDSRSATPTATPKPAGSTPDLDPTTDAAKTTDITAQKTDTPAKPTGAKKQAKKAEK